MANTTFPRGAKPSPRSKLLRARAHRVIVDTPAQFAVVPKQLSMWGNSQYGDCVSAEEAYAIACYSMMAGLPQRFVPEQTVIQWASRHGVLNGANLTDVMDSMARDGMQDSASNVNKDGPYRGVDYEDETVLQSAISLGPVKIAIDADALPSGAGSAQGWYSLGQRRYTNTDHCVSLSGYGPAAYLYQQLGVPMPAALTGKNGYLLFTWSTIGFVDHTWLLNTCVESWVRNPTTMGLPTPTPPAPPVPTPTTPYQMALGGDVKAGPFTLTQGGVTVYGAFSSDRPADTYMMTHVDPLPPS